MGVASVNIPLKFRNLVIQGRFHVFFLAVLFLFWLPILRFGFDPHHDGLIIASVNNLDFSDASMPFNQYGPAWFIVLKFITAISPHSYLFFAMRVITLSFYLFSLVVTYFLSKRFLSRRASLAVLVILLAIQPFITDFNSDMIPWPSALSMFLVPLVGILMLENTKFDTRMRIRCKMWLSGLLVVITTLTRVQIGIALGISVLFILLIYSRRLELLHFASALFAFSVLASLLFLKLGWFEALVTDVLGFGSTYAFGDRATYPKPIWTALLTLLFMGIFLMSKRISISRLSNRNYLLLGIALIFLLIIGIFILAERDLNPIQVLTVLFRRIWISALLAATITGVISLAKTVLKFRRLPDINFVLLVATSAVAELQVWPLFDQMHAWWSSTPCVILAALLVKSNPLLIKMIESRKLFIELAVLTACVLIATVTFSATVSHKRVNLPITGFSGVLISQSEGLELTAVNNFLSTAIKKDDVVLNLCTNANIFFKPLDTPKSAARSFIFWNPMFDLLPLRNDILASNPTKIVTCSFVTNPIFYPEYRANQLKVLENFNLLNYKPKVFTSPNGITWNIYSRGAQP